MRGEGTGRSVATHYQWPNIFTEKKYVLKKSWGPWGNSESVALEHLLLYVYGNYENQERMPVAVSNHKFPDKIVG